MRMAAEADMAMAESAPQAAPVAEAVQANPWFNVFVGAAIILLIALIYLYYSNTRFLRQKP